MEMHAVLAVVIYLVARTLDFEQLLPADAFLDAAVHQKWYISAEAEWEVNAVQDYVAAIAAHDLHRNGVVFLGAEDEEEDEDGDAVRSAK